MAALFYKAKMTDEDKIIKIAQIAKDKKEKLNGLKILGFIPFYVKYLRGSTIIEMCEIQAKIRAANGGSDVYNDTPINHDILKIVIPLIDEYITIGLLNNRLISCILKPFVKSKVRDCSEEQKTHLYMMLYKFRDPSFFLSYYPHLVKKDHTILKVE